LIRIGDAAPMRRRRRRLGVNTVHRSQDEDSPYDNTQPHRCVFERPSFQS
jgi:hypothetical protein